MSLSWFTFERNSVANQVYQEIKHETPKALNQNNLAKFHVMLNKRINKIHKSRSIFTTPKRKITSTGSKKVENFKQLNTQHQADKGKYDRIVIKSNHEITKKKTYHFQFDNSSKLFCSKWIMKIVNFINCHKDRE